MDAECDILVDDWGPCFHTAEEEANIKDWINSLVEARQPPLGAHGGQMEDLIWNIGIHLNGEVCFVCDQWVLVRATGILFKEDAQGCTISGRSWKYSISLQSDSHLAGLAGVYARLLCEQTKINIGMYDENSGAL